MSKIVFADGEEVQVNDVSSVYAITLDTVDQNEIEAFKAKLTPEKLKHVEIVNAKPSMCSQGDNFKFVEVETNRTMDSDEVPTATTFICQKMTEAEVIIMNVVKSSDATAEAVEELAAIIADLM